LLWVILGFLFLTGVYTPARASRSMPERQKSDLAFAENKNQWLSWVRYMGDLTHGKLVLEQNKISFFLDDASHSHHHTSQTDIHSYLLRIAFKGSSDSTKLVPADKESSYRNYFLGNDPAHWASAVGLYSTVIYKDIYPGIDAEVYGTGDNLKYQFRVKAGADVSQIALQYEGAQDLRLQEGNLHYSTTVGEFEELAPYAYQSGAAGWPAGEIRTVKCNYHLDVSAGLVTFSLPQGYDHSRELVIDPTLIFTSYTGSTADNWGFSATYDQDSNFYAGGIVFPYRAYVFSAFGSGTYPTTAGAFQTSYSSGTVARGDTCDIVLTKFNPTGTRLIYSTYLGGNGSDRPHSLIVDTAGNLYILGSTSSRNFPVSANAFDRSYNGNYDIIVTKMNATGTALLGSTYVGGSGDDGYNLDLNITYNYGDEVRGEIILDSLSNVYVSTSTKSSDLPVTSGAFQSTIGGGIDGCVFKMDPDLTQMLWCSYLGGSSNDAAYSVKLDMNQNLVVTGPTQSTDFHTTSGALHTSYMGGDCDGYVCKINTSGTSVLASTFLGTADHDQCFFAEIDNQNRIYILGQSLGGYPVSRGVYSDSGSAQFIQILDNSLSTSILSTVFGTGQTSVVDISPTAFLVDNCRNVYVSGWGGEVNQEYRITGYTNGLPVTANAYQSVTDGSDMYFMVLKQNLSAMLYGTFFGGSGSVEHVDGGTCRFDKKNGTIYSAVCAGCGANSFMQATTGAWSSTNKSDNCNYAALKFQMNYSGASVQVQASPRATGCVPLTVNFNSILTNVQTFNWDFGDGTANSSLRNPIHIYTDTGHYIVRLIGTNTGLCVSADTAYISVWVRNDSLSAYFGDSTAIDCYSKSINLSASNYPGSHFLWNFGDGSFSTANDTVSHVYTNPGLYTVSLTVTDTSKCNLQASFSAPVYVPPIVKIALTSTDTSGCPPLTVHPGNNTAANGQYHWDFGNGDTSTLRNPSYTYTSPGHYVIRLAVFDSTSCNKKDSVSFLVHVLDSAANAGFSVNRHFYNCDSVDVTVHSDYVGATWQKWDFGDGYTSTATTVSHRYRGAGYDTITHIVYDSRKICKQYDTVKIIVSLTPLRTGLSVPHTQGCLPFRAELYGSSPLLTTHYYWYFPGGDTAIGSPLTHTFSHVGSYRVLCVAIDSNACVNIDSNYATIVVVDDSVHARFNLVVLHDCDSNLSILLHNNSINAAHYLWTFGNGNSDTATNTSQHYTLPGTYTIKLLAIDTNRCHPRDSAYRTVTLKPNLTIGFTLRNICLGQDEAFVNLGSSSAQYHWTFGDNSSSSLYSPGHHYAAAGIYTATLTVKDTTTCNVYDTLRRNITVYQQPIAAFSMVADTAMFGDPVVFTNHSQHYNVSLWSFGDGDTSETHSPIHIYDHNLGRQIVCLDVYTQGVPCRDSICDSLYIRFVDLIGVPNAFSPNGDGINDIVKVEGKGIIRMEFRIYNRWGQQVYMGTDPKAGWDGTLDGVLQPMEVYTYTVDADLIDQHNVKLKGNITLLR